MTDTRCISLMSTHNPPHPGKFITGIYLEPNNISGRELAEKLGVAISTLSQVLNGSSHVTPNGLASFYRNWSNP